MTAQGQQELRELYTIGFYKLFKKTRAKLEGVYYKGQQMNAFFCEDEKGIYVIAGIYGKTAAHRSCGRWHSGDPYYKVYFRRGFRTREDGNEYYKALKATMEI
jgi:hypothetical protein